MSEPRSLQAIAPVRETLRPAEDLALMQSYELARFFDVGTVSALTRTDRVSAESFRPISVPLPADPEPAAAAAVTVSNDAPQARAPAEKAPAVRAAAPPQIPAVPAAYGTDAAEAAAGVADHVAQPYGWDPVRLRELVDWFVDGRQASAMVVAPKLAGDLLDAPSQTSDPPRRIRKVDASARAG